MTEHSKIPLPGGTKRSLFERAEDELGFGGFEPAPVPDNLAPAPNRPVRRTVRKAVMVEETVEQEAAQPAAEVEQPIAARPIPAEPAGAAPTPQLAAGRVEFGGARHPIDRARLRAQGLIVPEGPVTALLEEFRLVKRQILLAVRERAGSAMAQRVLVASPLPGEGKTFCAVNLALAIAAEKDSEVVLVDADFAKPSILSTLDLPASSARNLGLMDALARPELRIEDCVLTTDVAGLHVLPAGNQTATDSEYLASTRTAEVLARLTQGAPNRIVIFDSPPALAASPASELSGQVGQALVVCRADRTGQGALADALSLLSACPDIKLLLNAADFSPSGRRFGSYHVYGA